MKLRKTSKYLILYSGYTVGVARFNSADDQLTEIFLLTQTRDNSQRVLNLILGALVNRARPKI